jgi:hypothetical protein
MPDCRRHEALALWVETTDIQSRQMPFIQAKAVVVTHPALQSQCPLLLGGLSGSQLPSFSNLGPGRLALSIHLIRQAGQFGRALTGQIELVNLLNHFVVTSFDFGPKSLILGAPILDFAFANVLEFAGQGDSLLLKLGHPIRDDCVRHLI